MLCVDINLYNIYITILVILRVEYEWTMYYLKTGLVTFVIKLVDEKKLRHIYATPS